tara:strand:- start:256 stop:1719 length:1464 start_codon:yes stop_codon:yes gene_type:complete
MSETQSQLDLNLENYELFDILHVYGLPYDFTDHHIRLASSKLDQINSAKHQLDPEIPIFYHKSFVIIECIHKFREQQKLLNERYLSNHNDDGEILKTLLETKNFQNYDSSVELLNIVLKNNSNLVKQNQNNKRLHNEIQSRLSDSTNISNQHSDHSLQSNDRSVNYFDKANTDKQNRNIVDTYSNEAAPGKINSLKRIIQMKNVHINSCFREKYILTNPCDFKYTIPNEIKNVISMKLASIEIPNSWYLYSGKKKNNHFRITIQSDHKNVSLNIFVPDGNYNSETLVEYLNKEYFYMNQDENPDDPDNFLTHIKFSIDEFNNKTKIELVGDHDEELKFSLSFLDNPNDNLPDKLGWTLGFRQTEYLDIDDFIFSEGLFDAGGDRYIYFCVNDYQYNVNETNIICFDETTINENVLAKIPMINGKLCLIVDENDGCSLAKTRRYNGPVNLKRLDIKVMDQYGEIIDLNHMDFSFTLELEILYERNMVV